MTEEKIFLVKGTLLYDTDLDEYYFADGIGKLKVELSKEELDTIKTALIVLLEEHGYQMEVEPRAKSILKKLEDLK